MSTEAVKKFWQKASQDASLQGKLVAIQAKERQATVAAIMKLAGEWGFAFTAAEYDAAVKEELARQYGAGELDEEQLQQVAGGFARTALCAQTAQGCVPYTAAQSGCPQPPPPPLPPT